MKISTMREAFEESSVMVSSQVRYLATLGLAVSLVLLWRLEDFYYLHLMDLFICVLFLDLTQYVYKTLAWWWYNFAYWRIYKDESMDIDVGGSVNLLTWILFWGKVGALVHALYLLCISVRSLLP